MQTAEHPDASATASERDRLFTELLDGPVQPGDVDAMLEALGSAVAVAQPTPEAARSIAANASAVEPGPEILQAFGPALASSGTLPFLLAAEHAFHEASSSRFNGYGVPSHSFTTV